MIVRSLSCCVLLCLTACDRAPVDGSANSTTRLPDREETYEPSPEEIERADSLGEFEGGWLGKLHVISDENGLYREYSDGIDFRINIDGDEGWAELLLDGEWTLVTNDSAHVQKNSSSILISMFHVEDAYTFTVTITMHRAEPDIATVWLTRTSGTPYRSGDDAWKSHAVFAEGEVRSVDGVAADSAPGRH